MPDLVEQMYCSQQIFIPPNLPSILKKYAKAAIRTQPGDLLAWSSAYFRALAEGIPPPAKDRIEYPPVDTPSGISPGFLKVLINQIGRRETVHKDVLAERWKGVCLNPKALQDLLDVGMFEDEVSWLEFLAICVGTLEPSLTRTMIELCELLTEEPGGGRAAIPVTIFLNLYKYLAKLDCGPVNRLEEYEKTLKADSETQCQATDLKPTEEEKEPQEANIDWDKAIGNGSAVDDPDEGIVVEATDIENDQSEQIQEADEKVEEANVESKSPEIADAESEGKEEVNEGEVGKVEVADDTQSAVVPEDVDLKETELSEEPDTGIAEVDGSNMEKETEEDETQQDGSTESAQNADESVKDAIDPPADGGEESKSDEAAISDANESEMVEPSDGADETKKLDSIISDVKVDGSETTEDAQNGDLDDEKRVDNVDEVGDLDNSESADVAKEAIGEDSVAKEDEPSVVGGSAKPEEDGPSDSGDPVDEAAGATSTEIQGENGIDDAEGVAADVSESEGGVDESAGVEQVQTEMDKAESDDQTVDEPGKDSPDTPANDGKEADSNVADGEEADKNDEAGSGEEAKSDDADSGVEPKNDEADDGAEAKSDEAESGVETKSVEVDGSEEAKNDEADAGEEPKSDKADGAEAKSDEAESGVETKNDEADGGGEAKSDEAESAVETKSVEVDGTEEAKNDEADAGEEPKIDEADGEAEAKSNDADSGVEPKSDEADGGAEAKSDEADSGVETKSVEVDGTEEAKNDEADAGEEPKSDEADGEAEAKSDEAESGVETKSVEAEGTEETKNDEADAGEEPKSDEPDGEEEAKSDDADSGVEPKNDEADDGAEAKSDEAVPDENGNETVEPADAADDTKDEKIDSVTAEETQVESIDPQGEDVNEDETEENAVADVEIEAPTSVENEGNKESAEVVQDDVNVPAHDPDQEDLTEAQNGDDSKDESGAEIEPDASVTVDETSREQTSGDAAEATNDEQVEPEVEQAENQDEQEDVAADEAIGLEESTGAVDDQREEVNETAEAGTEETSSGDNEPENIEPVADAIPDESAETSATENMKLAAEDENGNEKEPQPGMSVLSVEETIDPKSAYIINDDGTLSAPRAESALDGESLKERNSDNSVDTRSSDEGMLVWPDIKPQEKEEAEPEPLLEKEVISDDGLEVFTDIEMQPHQEELKLLPEQQEEEQVEAEQDENIFAPPIDSFTDLLEAESAPVEESSSDQIAAAIENTVQAAEESGIIATSSMMAVDPAELEEVASQGVAETPIVPSAEITTEEPDQKKEKKTRRAKKDVEIESLVKKDSDMMLLPTPITSDIMLYTDGVCEKTTMKISQTQQLHHTMSMVDVQVSVPVDETIVEVVEQHRYPKWMHIPGIGPIVPDHIIEEAEKYFLKVAELQEGMVMPRNIKHFHCPPLELLPDCPEGITDGL